MKIPILLTLLVHASILSFANGRSAQPSSNKICETTSCVHTASDILKHMNPEVDPCDNFYQFACGGFEKYTIIPDDKSSVTTYGLTRDLVQDQMYSILQEDINKNELKAYSKLKKFYNACMNTSAIEKRSNLPLKAILKKLGGWPVLLGDTWKEDSYDWKDTMYDFRSFGYSIGQIIDFGITIDQKDTTKRIIELDQADLGISKEYFSKEIEHKVVKAYKEYMVDIAVMFGAKRQIATNELLESFNFEQKLADISVPNEERRNASLLYNPIKVKDLQKKYPYIPWKAYFNNFLAPVTRIEDNEIITISAPQYFEKLEEVLNNTTKRTIANYLIWRAVSASIPLLSKKYRDRQLIFTAARTGKTDRGARWKECVDKTNGRLSLAAGSSYVRKFFDQDAKIEALDMVNNLRSVFKNILENLDWMDKATKMEALDKAAAMTNHIAYPDELMDDKKLEDYYKDLKVNRQKYFESSLMVNMFSYIRTLEKFREPVNKTDWMSHGNAAVVNAFYSPLENSIQFPAGIFQGMFFAKDRPRYMNYGCIGFTIGHEITHGFDDHGRQFSKDGSLVDWWDPVTKEAFIKKAQCIVDQYGNYTVPAIGANLNGVTTQGENIADNGGMKEAYIAYRKWAEVNPPEPKLPGLSYTPNQMFWLSAANKWCSKYRPEVLEYLVLTDPHSPGMYRINGPMSNLPEFAKDYNCPLGSKMNPVKKCQVW